MKAKIFGLNVFLFAAIFVAALCAVAVRYEVRRLQTQVAALQQQQVALADHGRRLNLEIATMLDLAELYRKAIDEQNLLVPSVGDKTLLFLDRRPRS